MREYSSDVSAMFWPSLHEVHCGAKNEERIN